MSDEPSWEVTMYFLKMATATVAQAQLAAQKERSKQGAKARAEGQSTDEEADEDGWSVGGKEKEDEVDLSFKGVFPSLFLDCKQRHGGASPREGRAWH